MNSNKGIEFSEDFKEFLENMNKNYYIFPSLLCKKTNGMKPLKIREYADFIKEIEDNIGTIISGSSTFGKTALMYRLFSTLVEKDYTVLFCSAEIIVSASKNKKQNPQKLIDFVFNYNYGNNESLKQKFEQRDRNNCVFMFDDFDQVEDINLPSFIEQLKIYFGKIILSTNKSLDFDFRNISLEFLDEITKLEIEPLVGRKRKELIRQIVFDKSTDKSEKVINRTTAQIDASIKSLVNPIPPQPYYITQISEMYMNNIGEITNNSSSVFSKVFESNITIKVDHAIRNLHLRFSVELVYEILGKIAYFIHFNKAYPISRHQIDNIVQKYKEEFGTKLTTEDLINVSKKGSDYNSSTKR